MMHDELQTDMMVEARKSAQCDCWQQCRVTKLTRNFVALAIVNSLPGRQRYFMVERRAEGRVYEWATNAEIELRPVATDGGQRSDYAR